MSRHKLDLRRHLIVCGWGQTARRIAHRLDQLHGYAPDQFAFGYGRYEYLVIVREPEQAQLVSSIYPAGNVLVGDATDEDVLVQAGIERAFGIFPVLPEDKDNLFIAFTARQLNPSIRIVARSMDIFRSGQKLIRAGANSVISAGFLGGLRLVSEAARPAVTKFLDELMHGSASNMHIKEVVIAKAGKACGRSLYDLQLNKRFGLLVVAVVFKGTDVFVYNPQPSIEIGAGDKLVLFGRQDRLDLFAEQEA